MQCDHTASSGPGQEGVPAPSRYYGKLSAAFDRAGSPSDMEEWDRRDSSRAAMQERRWMAFRGQRAARELFKGYRDAQLRAGGIEPASLPAHERGYAAVCGCRWVRRSDVGVQVAYSSERQRAGLVGTVTCRSWSACPVCGGILAEHRAAELGQLVALARARGCVVALARFSDRHHAGDGQEVDDLAAGLAGQVDALLEAYSRMREHRAWRRLVERYGVEGPGRSPALRKRLYSVAAIECTWGYNGFHPHRHVIFLLAPGSDVALFQHEVRDLWYKARGGTESVEPLTGELVPDDPDRWEHGCYITSNDGEVAGYITKFGHPPRWDVAQEVTKGHLKRARVRRSKHYSMIELLWSYILAGDQQHGRLWLAFALAFKGRHQLRWADGLRAWAGLGAEQSDEEVIAEAEDSKDWLVPVDDLAWRRVLVQERRADLCASGDGGDPERVRAFLARLRLAKVVGVAPGPSDGLLEPIYEGVS